MSHVRSDLPRSLLPVSGADAVQVAQRLVIKRHAFGGQVLPQVGNAAGPGDEQRSVGNRVPDVDIDGAPERAGHG